MSHLLYQRSIPVGPEDPREIINLMNKKLLSNKHIFFAITYTSSVLSGLMVAFLVSAFLWRRSLVNRISLRLIFAMCLLDFIQSIFSHENLKGNSRPRCRAYTFFVDFMTASSCYLSSSIAFNLQMVFLRKSKKPLPKYTEILYFAVPMTVAFLQYVPQYIWSAKHGYCSTFEPVMQGTPRYIYTVILAYELIPGIFVFYNLITSVRVIMHLYVKQRKVSRALSEASHETRQLLTGSSDNAGSGFNSNTRRGSLSSKEVNQLKAVRKVYRACIRIALYPLTPLWWWVATAIFYWVQYPINMTFKWHADVILKLFLLSWTLFGSIIILNFLVFSTDPSVLHVFSELKKDIATKLKRRKTRGFQDTGSQEAIYKPKSRKDGITITEHTDFGTVHGDSSSIETDGLKNYHIESGVVHHSPSMLEDGGSFTTAYASLEDDDVIRRARAGEDVTGFYDNM